MYDTIRHAHIHDPAIIKDKDSYYIYGTHRKIARSKDLMNWEEIHNNFSDDPYALLGEIWQAWPKQTANSRLEGNTWAPDIIWNDTMHKWCMYLSVNGDDFTSVIVLLTADALDGDWTYIAPVVYSGFSEGNAALTDVYSVLGQKTDLFRYQSLRDTRINAIDAALAIDTDGSLWMSYGSWFGGIWMMELDWETGLRKSQHVYTTIPDISDAYYGIKIAGGHWNSGEGSYLVKTENFWHLFISYGRLNKEGGYQIRSFRSPSLQGPYVDQANNPAITSVRVDDNWTAPFGLRQLGSYAFSQEISSIKNGEREIAQGHNSVLYDNDGYYLVYHTRFIGSGEDDFESRIRRLYITDNEWPVTSPFEYHGKEEKVNTSFSDKLGIYEFIEHPTHDFYDATTHKNGTLRGVTESYRINLLDKGKVAWDNKEENDIRSIGTWSLEGTDRYGRPFIHITFDGRMYTGIFDYGRESIDSIPHLFASLVGDNHTAWMVKV